jgi:hypothetical protein
VVAAWVRDKFVACFFSLLVFSAHSYSPTASRCVGRTGDGRTEAVRVRVKADKHGIGVDSERAVDPWLQRSADFSLALHRINKRMQRAAGGGGDGGDGDGDASSDDDAAAAADAATGEHADESHSAGSEAPRKRRIVGASDDIRNARQAAKRAKSGEPAAAPTAVSTTAAAAAEAANAAHPRRAMYGRRLAQKNVSGYSAVAMQEIFGFQAATSADTLEAVLTGGGKSSATAAANAAADNAAPPANETAESREKRLRREKLRQEMQEASLKTVTSSLSVHDYFSQKMAALRAKPADGHLSHHQQPPHHHHSSSARHGSRAGDSCDGKGSAKDSGEDDGDEDAGAPDLSAWLPHGGVGGGAAALAGASRLLLGRSAAPAQRTSSRSASVDGAAVPPAVVAAKASGGGGSHKDEMRAALKRMLKEVKKERKLGKSAAAE